MLANLRSISYHNEESELQELPDILTCAHGCQYMSIVVTTLGTAEHPVWLDGSIGCVSVLHLEGEDLHVVISSDILWDSISFMATDVLHIRHVLAWLTLWYHACAHSAASTA